MVAAAHAGPERRGLLPGGRLAGKGRTDSHALAGSRQRPGVTIAGPVGPRPEPASAPGRRTDQDRVPSRLGPPRSHAEGFAAAQHPPGNGMAFETRFTARNGFPCPLRPRQARGPHRRTAGARTLQGAARGAQALENQGVPGMLRRPRQDRGHARLCVSRCGLRRCRSVGLAKTRLQLHDGCNCQPGQDRGMVRRRPFRENTPLALRPPANGGLTRH